MQEQPRDPFGFIEKVIFRLAFVCLLIYEIAKFFKHLLEAW